MNWAIGWSKREEGVIVHDPRQVRVRVQLEESRKVPFLPSVFSAHVIHGVRAEPHSSAVAPRFLVVQIVGVVRN